MNIEVHGYSDHVTENEWYRATEWYGNELLGRRLARNIDVKLQLVTRIEERACGQLIPTLRVNKAPRQFRIQINISVRKRKGQLLTLAHEMVHLRQLARRDLTFTGGVGYWKTKIFRLTDSDYEDHPWEVEAYEMEKPLYQRCSQYLREEGPQ